VADIKTILQRTWGWQL